MMLYLIPILTYKFLFNNLWQYQGTDIVIVFYLALVYPWMSQLKPFHLTE